MQGAGEEQRTKHAVEQRLVKVDGFEKALGFPLDADAARTERDQPQGEEQREHHQADRGRQLQRAVIEPAEDRRQRRQQREKVEEIHRLRSRLPLLDTTTPSLRSR